MSDISRYITSAKEPACVIFDEFSGEHNQAYSIYLTQAYNFGIPLQAYSSIPTQADNCQNITKLDSSIL